MLLFAQEFLREHFIELMAVLMWSIVISGFWSNRKEIPQAFRMMRRISWWKIGGVYLFETLYVGVMGYMMLEFPFLKYGWLSLFDQQATNLNFAPYALATVEPNAWVKFQGVLFFLAIAILMPIFAHWEESIFRRGKHTMLEVLGTSFLFGLVHLIPGVPVGVAIAQMGIGLCLAGVYLHAYHGFKHMMSHEKAMDEATIITGAYHAWFNYSFAFNAMLAMTFVMLDLIPGPTSALS